MCQKSTSVSHVVFVYMFCTVQYKYTGQRHVSKEEFAMNVCNKRKLCSYDDPTGRTICIECNRQLPTFSHCRLCHRICGKCNRYILYYLQVSPDSPGLIFSNMPHSFCFMLSSDVAIVLSCLILHPPIVSTCPILHCLDAPKHAHLQRW